MKVTDHITTDIIADERHPDFDDKRFVFFAMAIIKNAEHVMRETQCDRLRFMSILVPANYDKLGKFSINGVRIIMGMKKVV